MSYLSLLPDELYTKIYKIVYDDSVKNIESLDFFPLDPIIKDELRYCYVKKNNRVMLYCEIFSYGPAHTDLEYVYIDFTIRKKTYIINNSMMFYYNYARRRHEIRDIMRFMTTDMISDYLERCGYSNYKQIFYANMETPIPVNVLVFFQKCMDDESIY